MGNRKKRERRKIEREEGDGSRNCDGEDRQRMQGKKTKMGR